MKFTQSLDSIQECMRISQLKIILNYHDGNRKFRFHVQGIYGVDVWVEICIWDDEWGMLASYILMYI